MSRKYIWLKCGLVPPRTLSQYALGRMAHTVSHKYKFKITARPWRSEPTESTFRLNCFVRKAGISFASVQKKSFPASYTLYICIYESLFCIFYLVIPSKRKKKYLEKNHVLPKMMSLEQERASANQQRWNCCFYTHTRWINRIGLLALVMI